MEVMNGSPYGYFVCILWNTTSLHAFSASMKSAGRYLSSNMSKKLLTFLVSLSNYP